MGVLLELIKEIDIRPPQVLIESNIVEVSNENDLNLGVNWNANSTNGDPILTGAVNLPPTSALALPGAFTFGTIKSGFNVSATLNALETKKHGKVISRPRIATASGVQANITTTQNVLFQTEQDTIGLGGVVTRNFLATTLPLPINLTVTPRITDDGRITTVVNIQVTSVSGPAVGALPPPTSIQTATTTITTKNGETIVIGGLVRDVAQDTTNGIPILSSLPIIGTLFQEKDKTISKEELVIFITPTLLED
jgi:type II secretory pathway component GspD/PulD (secretin)